MPSDYRRMTLINRQSITSYAVTYKYKTSKCTRLRDVLLVSHSEIVPENDSSQTTAICRCSARRLVSRQLIGQFSFTSMLLACTSFISYVFQIASTSLVSALKLHSPYHHPPFSTTTTSTTTTSSTTVTTTTILLRDCRAEYNCTYLLTYYCYYQCSTTILQTVTVHSCQQPRRRCRHPPQ